MSERVVRAFGTARKLSAADAVMAARMTAVAVALPVLHRCLSLPSLMRLLDSPRRDQPTGDPERQVRIARRLLRWRTGPLKPGCFRRSLILFHGLRRSGHPVRVIFGVSEEDNALSGHSWLELNGEPFAEEADPRGAFRTVYSYPPSPLPEEDIP